MYIAMELDPEGLRLSGSPNEKSLTLHVYTYNIQSCTYTLIALAIAYSYGSSTVDQLDLYNIVVYV